MTVKLKSALNEGIADILRPEETFFLENLEEKHRFSFQQLKQLANWLIDARMWDEPVFFEELEFFEKSLIEKMPALTAKQRAGKIFSLAGSRFQELKASPKKFPVQRPDDSFPRYKTEKKELKGNIFRLCPAASEKAVCCNLKVLNIVENCAMECSYCVLQNHYDEAIIKVPSNLKEKLKDVSIRSDQRYRICTGEYSDSLMWGNTNNILTDLCEFAEKHPNIILEFKTKSSNIEFFKTNPVPKNICCSWSLNPEVIISNEEQKTANLESRLQAARTVADLGIKVAFHLHPMMYFEGWQGAYKSLIENFTGRFTPDEVLWVSLGTVTLMKGFDDNVRLGYKNSRILQMPTEETPDNKITYSYAIRKALYQNALEHLNTWKGSVFQYLCMEHKPMWDDIMDTTYKNMPEFNDVFNDSAFPKLG